MLSLDVKVLGIDGRSLRAKFENAQKDLVHEMRKEIETTWNDIAHRTLGSTEEEYRHALTAIIVDPPGQQRPVSTVEVSLMGALAVGVETGSRPYDMAPGFVKGKGSKKKSARRGGVRFRTVSYQGQMRVIPIDAGFPAPATPSGWKHPGIKARKLHEKVTEEWLGRIMPQLSQRFLGRISA